MRDSPVIQVTATVAELVSLQRRRKFAIKQQSMADRSIESLIAISIGFRLDADEKDRKKVFARAKTHRLAVEKGNVPQAISQELADLTPLVVVSAQNRSSWDKLREDVEREMKLLAKMLPIYPWVNGVRGLGALGFAIILAEAGAPLDNFHSVAALWKRMGLAVFDGERQRKKTDKTQAELHGYNPRRRAEMWAITDSLFRAQWRGADEEEGLEARPLGPYGEVYGRRRSWTASRIEETADLLATNPEKWTKARCNNDARRVMSKELLKDMWCVWRDNR